MVTKHIVYIFILGELSDQCTDNLDCSTAVANSICDIDGTNTCKCDPNYLRNGTECLPRNLGNACDTHPQCVFGISVNAVCDVSTTQCQCETGYISRGTVPDETCESRIITDTCNENIDCTTNIPSSECLPTNVCKCITGYDASPDNSECIAKILGDSCSDDADCIATITLSVCLESICTCPAGHIVITNNICKLRQILTDRSDCNISKCI